MICIDDRVEVNRVSHRSDERHMDIVGRKALGTDLKETLLAANIYREVGELKTVFSLHWYFMLLYRLCVNMRSLKTPFSWTAFLMAESIPDSEKK